MAMSHWLEREIQIIVFVTHLTHAPLGMSGIFLAPAFLAAFRIVEIEKDILWCVPPKMAVTLSIGCVLDLCNQHLTQRAIVTAIGFTRILASLWGIN